MLSVVCFGEYSSQEVLFEGFPRTSSIQGRFFGNDPLQMILYEVDKEGLNESRKTPLL
jgi:hypothetical protein